MGLSIKALLPSAPLHLHLVFLFACVCERVGLQPSRPPLMLAVSTGSEHLVVSLVNLQLLGGVSNFIQLSFTCCPRIIVVAMVA